MKISDIKKKCFKDMISCMSDTARDADQILDESFNQYYGGGKPKVYKRTFTLPNAKNINGPDISGDSVQLKAGYESSNLEYSTGSFSGEEVFGAVATGTYGVVGDKTFDENALEKIIQAASKNFDRKFK